MSDAVTAEPIAAEATIPTNPIIYAEAKRPFVMPTPAEYISAFLSDPPKLAAMQAGIQAAAPDVVTTDTPGILPLPIIGGVYNNFIGTRPVVDAIGARAMPSGGKVFIRPKVTTNTTIGGPVAENATLPDGTLVIDDIQITKEIFGGFVTLSEAVIDWTVPEVIGVLLDDMGRIYANETDAVAAAALFAGTTQTEALASFSSPTDWATFVGNSAVQILNSSNGNLPTHLFLSPDSWGFLMALSDTADRPLFPLLGPMNAYGSLNPSDDSGIAFGLRVVVDRNFAASTAIVGDASGFEIYEQQKGAISVDVPSTLSRTIAFRGYFASVMLDDTRFVAAV